MLLDSHIHLGFIADAPAFVHTASASHIALLGVSVTPREYEQTRQLFEPAGSCGALGVGAHPWWVARALGEDDIEQVCAWISRGVPVGEAGLDFSPAYVEDEGRARQLHTFERIVRTARDAHAPWMSLHGVHAYEQLLDVLAAYDVPADVPCVLHWFNGSYEDMRRAVSLGCYFGINPRFVATKKGCNMLAQMPPDRMLLETDWPPTPFAYIAEVKPEMMMRPYLWPDGTEVIQTPHQDATQVPFVLYRDTLQELFGDVSHYQRALTPEILADTQRIFCI